MRGGAAVTRTSQSVVERVGFHQGMPVESLGREPLRLAAARTESGSAVRVFMGAWSNVTADPGVDDELADDWIVVPDEQGRLKP